MTQNTVLKTLESYARLKTETRVIETWLNPASADYEDVRTATGKLAFRLDVHRGIVEWQDEHKRKHYIDLAAFVQARVTGVGV